MNRATTLVGASLLTASTALVLRDGGSLPDGERRLFRAFNEAPEALRPVLWPTMQLGNGLMAAAAPIAVVAATSPSPDWGLAARSGAAAFGAWQLAKLVKRFARRGRPAAFIDDVQFRDGLPDGLGFVSGHTAVATAVAAVLTPRLNCASRATAWSLVATVGAARMYVGAHLPLDVAGGMGLGALWGGLLAEDNPGAR